MTHPTCATNAHPDTEPDWSDFLPDEQDDQTAISALMRSIEKMHVDVVKLSRTRKINLQGGITRLENEIKATERHIIETAKNRKIDMFA